jgi:hypothetical protein
MDQSDKLDPEPDLHKFSDDKSSPREVVLWIRIRIRIRMDLHCFGNLNQHPDLHPHQLKIRIRIRNYIK